MYSLVVKRNPHSLKCTSEIGCIRRPVWVSDKFDLFIGGLFFPCPLLNIYTLFSDVVVYDLEYSSKKLSINK